MVPGLKKLIISVGKRKNENIKKYKYKIKPYIEIKRSIGFYRKEKVTSHLEKQRNCVGNGR